MCDPWAAILPIVEQHGTSASVEEFHRQVNIHFHAVESRVYDEVHCEMWESLPPQFHLLAQDVLLSEPPVGKLRMLDIGCGTGLSTQLLLNSPLGKLITEVCLLDTSREMLDRALARSTSWGVQVQGTVGLLSDLPVEQYDVVIACSVLHHVPFLGDFFKEIARRQSLGGLFLHLQDPNRDYATDPQLLQRRKELLDTSKVTAPRQATKVLRRRSPVRLAKRIVRGPQVDYIAEVNKSLIKSGVLRSPLSAEQIWTITDIHDAPDQSAGISLSELKGWLRLYHMVSVRSYGFFGKLVSRLPKQFTEQEIVLTGQNALNGHFLGASWRKKV